MKNFLILCLTLIFNSATFAESGYLPEKIVQLKNETMKAYGNELAIFDSITKITLILEKITPEKDAYKKISERLIENIQKQGVHDGLLIPSLKTLEAIHNGNRIDLAELFIPVIHNLNPAIGNLLYETYFLPLTDSGMDIFEFNFGLKARINDPFERKRSHSLRLNEDSARWGAFFDFDENEIDFSTKGEIFGTGYFFNPSSKSVISSNDFSKTVSLESILSGILTDGQNLPMEPLPDTVNINLKNYGNYLSAQHSPSLGEKPYAPPKFPRPKLILTSDQEKIENIIIKFEKDTIGLKENPKLIEENARKLSLVLSLISNNKVPAETIRDTIMENSKGKGTYEGLIKPSLKLIDGFYASGRTDLIKFISPIINTLNPKIGDTLEEKLGLPLAYGEENKLSNFKKTLIEGIDPFSREDLPSMEDNYVISREGPIFGSNPFGDPVALSITKECVIACIGGFLGGALTGGKNIGGIIRNGIGGAVISCTGGACSGEKDKPNPAPKDPQEEPNDPKEPREPPTKPEGDNNPNPLDPISCREKNCDDDSQPGGNIATTTANPDFTLDSGSTDVDDWNNSKHWTTPVHPIYWDHSSSGGNRNNGNSPETIINPGNPMIDIYLRGGRDNNPKPDHVRDPINPLHGI